MKVLALNGSFNREGNTYQALQIAAGELRAQNIDVEIVHIGEKNFKGCTGCHACMSAGRCVNGDEDFFEIVRKMHEADGIILGSPVYFGGINGPMKSFLDRAFFSSIKGQMRFKVGASLVVLRRIGSESALAELNTFLQASEMLLVPSGLNIIFGAKPGEIQEDKEGLWRLTNLGRYMAWLLRMKDMTKEALPPPESVKRVFFNVIR